jgi:hypothetical protein
MKLCMLVVVASCLAPGAIGCASADPCQDLIDAVDKASKLEGCATQNLEMYKAGLDPKNCMLPDSQMKIVEAEATCFDQLTSCDQAQMTKLSQCVTNAQNPG